MKKTVIIVFEYGYYNGGSAKIAIQTALGLVHNGYNVVFFCACGPVDDVLSKSGCRVVCLNQYDILTNPSRIQAIKQGIWNKEAYKQLNKLLDEYQKERPTVHIHGYSHILSASIIKACENHKIKPYITLHEYFSICPNGGMYNYQRGEACKYSPMSLSCIMCNCDSRSFFQKCYRVVRQMVQDRYIRRNKNLIYIYISNFSLSIMKPYLSGKNFYYVHNPVEKMNVNRKENAQKIYYIGRLSPEKGVDLFCEAVEKAGFDAVIVGDGVLREKLIAQYQSIDFLGWKNKEELQKILCDARCVVFPSRWYETDGLVVQECLGAGIPCVVSDNCSARDYIIEGQNGCLFANGDVNDLINKIEKCNTINPTISIVNSMEDYMNTLIMVYEKEEK